MIDDQKVIKSKGGGYVEKIEERAPKNDGKTPANNSQKNIKKANMHLSIANSKKVFLDSQVDITFSPNK